MNTKKALFSLAFIVFLALATSAQAATNTDSRYFVKSTSTLWKKSFQVRNVFDSGFTTDLSDWQLRMAKVFGVEVTPVKKLNILAASTPTPTPTPTKKPPLIKTPVNQIGWGVQALYNDALDNALPSGGKDVKVAILDTGILTSHPDLKSQITVCDDFTASDAFVKNSCDDKNGHGTQVAGVVAADGGQDGKGIYGVAPEASLMIYKVCSMDGTCFADDVAAAIRRATDDGANVILLSFGSDTVSSIMNDSIAYAHDHGALVIAAAGNDGPYKNSIDYPASNAAVIGVGAVDQSLSVADWSARGISADITAGKKDGELEFVAPGVNIESTSNNTDYVTTSGTSLAAAHIAGLAAKEWQSDAEHPAEATRDFLHKISQSVSSKPDSAASGWGMPSL